MNNNSLYNWTIKNGDYIRQNGEYDKLYKKGIKRDKIMRFAIWIGAGFLTYIVFFKVLAYAAAR
ncbi:MAG: hypothetical protein KA747_06730 [Ignavibacteriaceae bacterium]|jgi:hypothetical protein|nr:hypothetical protein [Ignavibacteriaceae bacterium]